MATDSGRIAALLPLRYSRMSTDPFAFLRGGAAIMAADLGARMDTGLRTQLSGDAHLANFGPMAGARGDTLFDVCDFDETQPGPFEWDVKRLAASLVVAGRVQGLSDKACRALALRMVRAYRLEIATMAQVSPIDCWGARIEVEDAIADIGAPGVRRRERQRLQAIVEGDRGGYRSLVSAQGRLRLVERPPALFRLGAHEDLAHAAFAAYEAGLGPAQRVLVSRYRLVDVVFKAVGVGSVGTFCAIGLYATPDGDDLLLQLKEARPSVLAPFAGRSMFAHQGERVVAGQHMLQAEPDVFLSFTQSGGRDFYVRRLKDPRLASIAGLIEAQSLPFYARLCGRTLGRAHARAGDAASIAGYLGQGNSFIEAIAHWAMAYANQTERDFHCFRSAIASGRIEAQQEPTP